MRDLSNLGLKVRDLDAELAFLRACGATRIEKGALPRADGDLQLGIAYLGDERLLLFPKVIYEDRLPQPLHYGLTHAVYEVDDLAETLRRSAENGVVPFWGPTDQQTPFGPRRIAFFRSPSGFIFETFQRLG